jgi:hypothetical protein
MRERKIAKSDYPLGELIQKPHTESKCMYDQAAETNKQSRRADSIARIFESPGIFLIAVKNFAQRGEKIF